MAEKKNFITKYLIKSVPLCYQNNCNFKVIATSRHEFLFKISKSIKFVDIKLHYPLCKKIHLQI